MRKRGLLVVISGPAGSGKSTLAEEVMAADPSICRGVTATTRAPRPGERDGVDYFFLTQEEFLSREAAGGFAETNCFNGNHYGTPMAELNRLTGDDKVVLLVIDVNGARQLRASCPDCVQIFILPPSPTVLQERLSGRGTESEADVEKRLAIAEAEIRELRGYDFLVINDRLAPAADELKMILDLVRTHYIRGDEAEAWAAGRFERWHA